MKLGIHTQGFVRRDGTAADRIRQIVKEAQLADELGLDAFGISEQHFKFPTNTGAPIDALYGAIAQSTERIRLRPGVVILPLHHPLNVAERWACIDVLSNGRVDFGFGRGNTPLTADVFQVPIPQTEERAIESLKIILEAWTKETFTYQGKYWQIPELSLMPRPVQKPHPPLFWAATSPGSHETGGRLGMGLMTGSNAMLWDQVGRRIERYREGLAHAEPLPGAAPNHHISLQINGHCTTSLERARQDVGNYVMGYVNRTVTMYAQMVARTGQNVGFEKALQFRNNWDSIVHDSPAAFGSPDDCIKSLLRIREEYAVDEVEVLIDGATHEQLLECIRLFAKEVRPAILEARDTAEAATAAA